MNNPIIDLAQLCQKLYGENITTKVISVDGPHHTPDVTVQINIPDGRIFEATAKNKRLAKQKAALAAFQKLNK